MAKHHHGPEATFRAWNDIWLRPGFRSWNIESYLSGIDCPVLLIRGSDDEYGTIAQLDAIENGVVGPVDRLVIDHCGHSPHLSQPDLVLDTAARFVRSLA